MMVIVVLMQHLVAGFMNKCNILVHLISSFLLFSRKMSGNFQYLANIYEQQSNNRTHDLMGLKHVTKVLTLT